MHSSELPHQRTDVGLITRWYTPALRGEWLRSTGHSSGPRRERIAEIMSEDALNAL